MDPLPGDARYYKLLGLRSGFARDALRLPLPPHDVELYKHSIGIERVPDRNTHFIQWTLRQPGHPHGFERHEISHLLQCSKYLIGSNRRSDMSDDHVEYDTLLRQLGVRGGDYRTFGHCFHQENGTSGVKCPEP